MPGILAYTMSADDENPLLVHDLQVFENKSTFDAHGDLSNEKYKKIMMDMVLLYDPTFPIEGVLWI